MKRLTRDGFKQASRFIETNGRPLEVARFKYEFCEAPATTVLEALSSFQNADGGFGRALEPDLRAPESSTLCTSIALQILRTLDVSKEISLVSNALEFLCSELNEELLSWRIIPASAEKSPRAPWWYQKGREEQFELFSLNPTAELLGDLFDHPDYMDETTVERISKRVVSEVISLETIEMHDLLCCLRLLKAKRIPAATRDPLHAKLGELVRTAVCCDPDKWSSYSLRPVQIVDEPQAPFASGLETAIDLNLDYEIQSQGDNGAWIPTWAWDDQYPDDWKVAECEWTGILTLEKLLLLKRFDRIE